MTATYEALQRGAAWRIVPGEGVLVSGPGARDWLQGQVSQDLNALDTEAGGGTPSVESLVLSPQGKVDAFCRVSVADPETFLLDVRAGFGAALEERLRRFKLRVKADLELLPALSVVQVRGPASPPGAELAAEAGPEVLAVVEVSWPGWSGCDIVLREAGEGVTQAFPLLKAVSDGSVEAGANEAFEAARIEAGVPELGLELTERTIPQEAGELVAHAVSFTKGCYTGQELVARIDARGSNTPRRLQGVVVAASARDGQEGAGAIPARGDAVLAGGATVGELTSVARSPGLDAYVALAYIKRGTEIPSEALVRTADADVPASIRRLPLVKG